MRFLKKYLKRYIHQILLGQSFKLVEAILELLLPLVMAGLIDMLTTTQNGGPVPSAGELVWAGGKMLLLAAVGVGTALVCQVTASRASQSFGTELRHDLFSHITTLSPVDLERFGSAGLINRMTGDINQLQTALAMLIRLVVRAPFLAVGSIIMAVILDVSLSTVFLVTTPLICIVIWFITRACLPRFRSMQTKTDTLIRITGENLSGARVVRAFCRQKQQTEQFSDSASDYTVTAVRTGWLNALISPLTTVIMDGGIIAVLLLSRGRVQLGVLTEGVVIAFINYLLQILTQTAIVANLINIFTKAAASARRVGEVLETVPSLTVRKTNTPAGDSSLAVAFRNVGFTYQGAAAEAVSDLSFEVHDGESIGIIGGTGCGKTTLARLISRFRDADRGSILLFGKDIVSWPIDELHRMIGEVPQHASLFSGTLRKNLSLNGKETDDAFLHECLDIAQASEFVSEWPDGLDHVLLEGGKDLSGGQRQRLTIARALALRPRILILDDSLSALDLRTDALLRQALADKTKGTTKFIISQRVTAVMDCDRILVMDDGRIAGFDTHDVLMHGCEVYREICLTQLKDSGAGKEAVTNEK